MAFSPDGRTLATSHQDGTVRLWNVADRTPGHVLRGHAEKARWAVFSPDGRTLATADDGSSTIRLWDVGTGALRTTFTGHEDVITALAFSPDSSTLAATGRDQTIRRWAAAPAQQRIFAGHTGSVVALALSKDGSTLATSSLDTTVRLWSARSGASRLTLTRVSAALALSPDGRTVATTNPERNVVHLRSALTGRTRLALPHPRKGAFVVLAFSPDGRTLATISESNSDINLWSTATGRLQRTVVSPNGDIAGLSFSPDGQVLATVSDNSRDISLWNAATGRLVRGFTGPSPHSAFLAFSPDGKTLATSDAEGPVRLWDTTTGHHRIFMGATKKVAVLAFSPDGRTLATGDDQAHDVKLWDTATGALRRTHQGSRESLLSATFRPDGKAIAVGYAKTVGLWNVDLPDESSAVNRLCQAFNRTPTREERNQYPIGPDPCPEDAPRSGAQGYVTHSGALEGEGGVHPGRFRHQRATTPSHPPSPASSARPAVRGPRPIRGAGRRRSDAEGSRRPSDIGRISVFTKGAASTHIASVFAVRRDSPLAG
ncbi:WD40 repeat domain-containing protein [Streptomyces sp. NPDC020412]|uniref:WD40 repeat domain-containing protein n=1 Tax=Streptomyces sp. NPDC020412 TaxID=3365073 RepID=UPI0037A1D14D